MTGNILSWFSFEVYELSLMSLVGCDNETHLSEFLGCHKYHPKSEFFYETHPRNLIHFTAFFAVFHCLKCRIAKMFYWWKLYGHLIHCNRIASVNESFNNCLSVSHRNTLNILHGLMQNGSNMKSISMLHYIVRLFSSSRHLNWQSSYTFFCSFFKTQNGQMGGNEITIVQQCSVPVL